MGRILEGSSKVGDCVGLSSSLKFLLDSRGLETRALSHDEHVTLEVKVDGEFIPVESTIRMGYGVESEARKIGEVDLISLVANSSSSVMDERGCLDLAMEFSDKAISLD